MRSPITKALKYLFFAAALLSSKLASAQVNYHSLALQVDSLDKVGLPQSALKVDEQLDSLARKNNNVPAQLEAIIFRVHIQPQIDVDYSQAGGISWLEKRTKQSVYPLKPILQSLLGQLFWEYYQQNRYRISQRSRLQHADIDFTNWDMQTVMTHAAQLYDLSLQDAVREQRTEIDLISDVLQGDMATRYLRPTLYDLLLHRALDFFMTNEVNVTKPRLPFTLNDPRYLSDSRTFAGLQIMTSDTSSDYYKGLRYLQQGTRFHLGDQNKAALADLDLRRLEFVWDYSPWPDKDTLYVTALKKMSSGDALTALGKYFLDAGDNVTALNYFKQAGDALNAANYIKEITQANLKVTVEEENVPDKPLLAAISYRNAKTAKIGLYKVSLTTYTRLAAMHDDRYGYSTQVEPLAPVFDYLKNLKPLRTETIGLPAADDYKMHFSEFKIDPLQTGMYIMVVQDPVSDDIETRQITSFRITHLAFATRHLPDGRSQVIVTDRQTGAPLQNVQVTADETNMQTSDANGSAYFNLNGINQYAVKLTTPTDTLYSRKWYRDLILNNSASAVNRLVLFTDREIYRPGQVIYFKGLYLKAHDGKNTLLPNKKINYSIEDQNGKVLAEVKAATNDFGSFAGSYVIPPNILNGSISIVSLYGRKYVSVEEYKRPNFMVNFLPVKESYRPDDSVTIKGKVTAYSGYGLSMARVAVHINRFEQPQDYRNYNYRPHRAGFQNQEFLTDTITTDEHGDFSIKFKAAGETDKNVQSRYNISADVTYGSGETRSASTSLLIGSQNITVYATVPLKLNAGDSTKIVAAIDNLNGIAQPGQITLNVYALKAPGKLFKQRLWESPDQHLLTRADYEKYFPEYAYAGENNQANWPVLRQVTELERTTDANHNALFDQSIFKGQPTGIYKLIVSAKNNSGDTVSERYYVKLIDKHSSPLGQNEWVVAAGKNAVSAQFYVGTGKTSHVLMEKFNDNKLISSKWLHLKGNIQQAISIPVDTAGSQESVQFLTFFQNREYTDQEVISSPQITKKLDIKFLSFRDKLQPGEKEQWKLQISGNDAEQAEMVASLYDASLDALSNRNTWLTAIMPNFYRPFGSRWSDQTVNQAASHSFKYNIFYFTPQVRNYEQLFISASEGDANQVFMAVEKEPARLNGLEFADPGQANVKGDPSAQINIDGPVGNSLAEVSVRGYGTKMREDTTEYKASAYNTSNLPADVLKSVQMVDDYGDQANLSGITTRKNFAETAFFYPQLHTDENGLINIDFTIPEELTTWRFRAFAHTKDLKTGYADREIVTQKELSIIAHAPRFLREGDTITLSATLANLTDAGLKGKVELQLFNAVTMQPVNLLMSPVIQDFDLKANSNAPMSFKLAIPGGLDALTYKLTAVSGQYSDGEENTLPVLPNRMLVTESMPMLVRAGQTKSFTFTKLITSTSKTLQNKTLTLEYTQNPAWYAVQSLPYMMEFPYECAEQVFNRYYANSFATNIISKQPAIQQIFTRWKNSNSEELLSNLEKNQNLKSGLIEETPWLREAVSETEQKKRIALLFDLNTMSYQLNANLDKLKSKQLPGGAFPWFGGDEPDRYITQYILAGMGQLYHLNMIGLSDQKFKDIADKAMAYLDEELLKAKNDQLTPLEIHAYYAQSYFTARTLGPAIQTLLNNYLERAKKQWVHRSLYEQAMIALTMLRNNRPLDAAAISNSLKETAQHSDELGMYWPKNTNGYYWYQSPIEVQSLLIELFTEAGGNANDIGEMKVWLLRNKQANDWKTTKATAAACYALLMRGNNDLLTASNTAIKISGQRLQITQADAGTGYSKTTWTDKQIKPALGKVELKNSGKGISWGALHWQYLENLDKISSGQTNIHLERKYYIEQQTGSGRVLVAVNATHQPKTGELLKVVIHVTADRDFEYVQLKDMRPAGTEPVDVLSSYKYQDGLAYYQVTKDVGTNFFISELHKGNYVFEYELRVEQPGDFSTGITSIQSMYAPEFNAHSAGERIKVVP